MSSPASRPRRCTRSLSHSTGFATVRRYDGMPHGFLSLPSVNVSKLALQEIAAALTERLASDR